MLRNAIVIVTSNKEVITGWTWKSFRD